MSSSAGMASLAGGYASTPMQPSRRRVTVVAHELRGFLPIGGMGTATTFLTLALARAGHSVEILLGRTDLASIDPYWDAAYRDAGVRIRPAPASHEPVEPWQFVHAHAVQLGLRAAPPDVVVAHDFGGPAYSALRLRQAGVAFEDTLFVLYCHGTRRYIMDLARDVAVKDLRNLLAVTVHEQAAVELADVVVSPSHYLVDWMRGQGWRLPERTLVIPYFTRSSATGEPVPSRGWSDGEHLDRLAFFGRLDEKKGVELFAAALNALEPELIGAVELEFIGRPTATWTRDRVEGLLSGQTRQALRAVSFETELDQHEALARLGRPGTLAVMPSLQENSPNAVYECLEHGIPFIASDVGGVPELIAPDDRRRVLFEPTAREVEAALRRVLSAGLVPRPADGAHSSTTAYERWAEVVELRPRARSRRADGRVDVIVVRRRSRENVERCVAAVERQSYRNFTVRVSEGTSAEAAREDALRGGSAPYIVFLDEEDVPNEELLQTLVQAQRASGADVVTCGVRLPTEDGGHVLHFFIGAAEGLGVLSNAFGTVGLFRREVLGEAGAASPAEADADWPLLAGLSASGARIVSVPLALVTRNARPGSVELDSNDALLVAQQLEGALPHPSRSTARLVAGLAANAAQRAAASRPGFARRALRRLARSSG